MKTHILIIGGDGDLAMRKLYRSLFSLDRAAALGNVVSITGMGRQGLSRDSFLEKVANRLSKERKSHDSVWQRFSKKLHFHQGDATSEHGLQSYVQRVAELDSEFTPSPNGSRLIVYLAVPPKIFGPVSQALYKTGLNQPQFRLVIEKPLGNSEPSFLEVDAQLSSVFQPHQIYRIDHYLGKESVQNLIALRFSNIFFEPLWNSKYIDSVQITVAEAIGVEQRKAFYDEIGALKDMVQNHLLQILCLVAMEPPVNRNAEAIQAEKLKVLQSLAAITPSNVNEKTVRGQYDAGFIGGKPVPGYLEDCGVPASQPSSTETYMAIKAELNSWRWSGVPFYLRTGKRLAARRSEILIQFKPIAHNIFSASPDRFQANQILIKLQPDSGIDLRFMHKRPGFAQQHPLEAAELNLSAPSKTLAKTYDAYARLLFDVIHDDQSLFVSAREVQESWRWIDQITSSIAGAGTPVYPYPAGSMGPDQAIAMLARDRREWH